MPATGTADENQPNRGTKRVRSEEGESSVAPRAGKGAVGGAAVDGSTTGRYICPRSRITDEWHVIQFKKTHKLLSFGIAPTLFKHKITQAPPYQVAWFLTTALLRVPVHSKALYLTPGEHSSFARRM
jgi:hypothetical protein